MPKLPHISGAHAVRIFERMGFVVMRQNGSHIVLRKGWDIEKAERWLAPVLSY